MLQFNGHLLSPHIFLDRQLATIKATAATKFNVLNFQNDEFTPCNTMRNTHIHFFYFIHDDFIVFIINVNEGPLLFCNPSAQPTSKIHQHLRRQDLPPVVTRRQVSDEQITCKTDSVSPLSSSSSLSSHLTSILQINCTKAKKTSSSKSLYCNLLHPAIHSIWL